MTSPRRWILVLGALLLAPVCAEFSSGYLPSTGKPLELLNELVIFAPLYGGALLLIRETVVRLGGGWPSRVLLSLAFGIAMPGLIDLSLFTTVRTDVDGWDQIFTPTYVDALGTSLGAATSFANPPPDGVTESAKLAQNAAFALVVLVLLVAISRRRQRSPGSPPAGRPSTSAAA
jgi:MYXO-CTERM domain-containing protein